MSENIKKLATRAKEKIKEILYITIATSNKNGEPWNSPVYSAFDQNYTFYWTSWIQNQHSKNIKENKNVFIVIYDSTVPEGTGFGIYLQGEAYQLDKNNVEEITKASKLLARRVNKNPRNPEQYLEGFPRRIFKFVPKKVWVNSSNDVKGNFVDARTDITSEILNKLIK